jgi:hypothetical protein
MREGSHPGDVLDRRVAEPADGGRMGVMSSREHAGRGEVITKPAQKLIQFFEIVGRQFALAKSRDRLKEPDATG